MIELLGEVARYIAANQGAYMASVKTHLFICVFVLFVSCIVGITLGVASIKNEFTMLWAVNLFNTLKMIPSMALLLLMLPILGTGFVPAFIALSLHAIPVILINTYTGFKTIPAAILESAHGIGLSRAEVLMKIEFPLAMPLIFTGIRTSAVDIIASGTLVAYIGAGGLGEFIVSGLSFMDFTIMMTGALSVAVIAVVSDMFLALLQRKLVWRLR